MMTAILPRVLTRAARGTTRSAIGSVRGMRWSVELEPHPEIAPASSIIREGEINDALRGAPRGRACCVSGAALWLNICWVCRYEGGRAGYRRSAGHPSEGVCR